MEATTRHDAHPRVVTRGAESRRDRIAPRDGVSIGIDGLRMSGPGSIEFEVFAWMVEQFGDEHREAAGGHGYSGSIKWSCGATLYLGHTGTRAAGESDDAPRGLAIEINGTTFAEYAGGERVNMLEELLQLGMKTTRLDIAVDVVNQGMELVENAEASCRSREMVRFRRWAPVYDFNLDEKQGHTVYLGKRGDKGSGFFTRVYDKGLEQTHAKRCGVTFEQGYWERWEVELTGDVGVQASWKLVQAREWHKAAASIAIGKHQFREATGRRELDRRPMVAWFFRLVRSLAEPMKITARRVAPTVASRLRWLRDQVGPGMAAMAKAAHVSVASLFDHFVKGVQPQSPKRSPVLRQWMNHLVFGDAVPGVCDALEEDEPSPLVPRPAAERMLTG
ncbi:MAG: replication initiation factor domain-containing protein [Planctomycetota bacterium]